ncbi:hypothetical protein BC829DRAFT_412515 [Chytridium lagenaria]|nr:hypothetical protein BC829DRAFT_412515 [Chytridium lagenaria]
MSVLRRSSSLFLWPSWLWGQRHQPQPQVSKPTSSCSNNRRSVISASIEKQLAAVGGVVTRRYDSIHGLAIQAPASFITSIEKLPEIAAIEADQPMHTFGKPQRQLGKSDSESGTDRTLVNGKQNGGATAKDKDKDKKKRRKKKRKDAASGGEQERAHQSGKQLYIEYVAAPAPVIQDEAFKDYERSLSDSLLNKVDATDEVDDEDKNKGAEVEQGAAKDEDNEDDEEVLSKKKKRLSSRLSVAQLKQLVSKPDVVDWVDITAADPSFSFTLKPTEIPSLFRFIGNKSENFIKATGIMELRETVREKEDGGGIKGKVRDRMAPKMGKLDIDYQKLHDAFFRWQTKPPLSIHGDMYYEGKEFETKLKLKKPVSFLTSFRKVWGELEEEEEVEEEEEEEEAEEAGDEEEETKVPKSFIPLFLKRTLRSKALWEVNTLTTCLVSSLTQLLRAAAALNLHPLRKRKGVAGVIDNKTRVEVALNPEDLEGGLHGDAVRKAYEGTVKAVQESSKMEDFSDMVAEHASRQAKKRKKDDDKKSGGKKDKDKFKF